MAIPSFTANIPLSSQSLGNTQAAINNNFGNYNGLIAVNHGAPNSTNQGKHTFVEMPVRTSAPSTLMGEAGLYALTVGSNSEMFFRRDTQSTTYRISGNSFTTQGARSKGGTIPLWGGLYLQWGQVLYTGGGSGAPQAVSFVTECGQAFPNNCWIVMVDNGGTDSSVTKTGFNLSGINNQDYNFIAIGN